MELLSLILYEDVNKDVNDLEVRTSTHGVIRPCLPIDYLQILLTSAVNWCVCVCARDVNICIHI